MSTRIAYFELGELRDDKFRKITDEISKQQFTTRSATGFLIDRRDNRSLESRFVEKVTSVETFVDPFGNEFKQERTHFNEIKFQLRKSKPELIVFNANSAFKAFTGRILQFADFQLSITPLEWAPLKIVERFEKEFENLTVYAAIPQPLSVSPSVSVRLAFEGSEDVRKHVRNFTKNRNTHYLSLKVQFTFASTTIKCEIKDNGSLVFFGETDPALLEKAMEIVEQAVRSFKAQAY
jgi:hypothetical protein